MIKITEQCDATVDITTNAEKGSEIKVFAAKYYGNKIKKELLSTYNAPSKNTKETGIRLETSHLDVGKYHVEVWSVFGTDDQQRRITTDMTIQNSAVI